MQSIQKNETRPETLERKRTEAQQRQEGRDTLSPEEQIEVLNRRLGKGRGARKERARLDRMVEERDNPGTNVRNRKKR